LRLEIYRRNLAPRAGAVELLTYLRAAGYRIGLVSDCAAEIPMLWPQSTFAPLIEATVFSVETGARKPHQRNYRLICEQLGVAPERCLYIGDGGSRELTGATQFGMQAVLISVPYERHLVMEREDAQQWQGPVVESLGEVLGLLSA
jgi:putative hydrolase of the HAD superfamily